MWSYGLDLRSIKLTVVKVVVSSAGTCNNCLFVEVFNYFLNCSNKIFDFLASNLCRKCSIHSRSFSSDTF